MLPVITAIGRFFLLSRCLLSSILCISDMLFSPTYICPFLPGRQRFTVLALGRAVFFLSSFADGNYHSAFVYQ